MMPSHTELIINRLRQDGIHIEKRLTHFDWSIDLDEKEYTWAQKCFNSLDIPRGHVPIAVGIGGDRAIVRWSYDKFKELLLLLKESYPIYPIFFGGKNDEFIVSQLLNEIEIGYSFAGKASLKEAIVLLRHCVLYVGNATGTMHMANLSNIPCVVIFSGDNFPGLWYPWGKNNYILRVSPPCHCCRQFRCVRETQFCLEQISVYDVFMSVEQVLGST